MAIFNKKNIQYILTGILLLAFLVISVLFLKQKKLHDLETKPQPIPVVPYYPVPKTLGLDTAPVKIIEYSDYECPSCRVAQDVAKMLLLKYPGRVQLTFHHFPLNGHKWSIYAHQAAECMHIQGKFWPYSDRLYASQADWAPMTEVPIQKFIQYAKECGANMELFDNCMADPKVTSGLQAEKNEGTLRQVNATPTFFIGNKRYVGPKDLQERGENDIRRILGMPELSSASKKPAVSSPTSTKSQVPLHSVDTTIQAGAQRQGK